MSSSTIFLLVVICLLSSAFATTNDSNSTTTFTTSAVPSTEDAWTNSSQKIILGKGKNSFQKFVTASGELYLIRTGKDSDILLSIDNATNREYRRRCDNNLQVLSKTSMYDLCHSSRESWHQVIVSNDVIISATYAGFRVLATRLIRVSGEKCRKEHFICRWRPYCVFMDLKCDGQQNCPDASDEFCTCNLPGLLKQNSTRSSHPQMNRTWKIGGYTVAIAFSVAFLALVLGFLFHKPGEDERRRRDAEDQSEGRLDPMLDHPPSYEDVLRMDLTAAPHQRPPIRAQDDDSP